MKKELTFTDEELSQYVDALFRATTCSSNACPTDKKLLTQLKRKLENSGKIKQIEEMTAYLYGETYKLFCTLKDKGIISDNYLIAHSKDFHGIVNDLNFYTKKFLEDAESHSTSKELLDLAKTDALACIDRLCRLAEFPKVKTNALELVKVVNNFVKTFLVGFSTDKEIEELFGN